jgi:hypothetical protein
MCFFLFKLNQFIKSLFMNVTEVDLLALNDEKSKE